VDGSDALHIPLQEKVVKKTKTDISDIQSFLNITFVLNCRPFTEIVH